MRFDLRAFIVGLWITVGVATIGSDFVFANYDSPQEVVAQNIVEPNFLDSLNEAIPLVYGFWIAAMLTGLAIGFSGLSLNVSLANALGGYWAGTLIRLAFLKQFIPGTAKAWTLLANAFQLKSLPEYHLFLLLVLVGGSLFVGIAIMLADAMRRQSDFQWLEPDEPLLLRPMAAAILTPALLIFSAIFVQTMREPVEIPLGYERQLVDALLLNGLDWLVRPVPNMIAIAISGALIGLGYMTPSRDSAARVVLIGAMAHVVIMLLMDVLGGFYTYELVNGVAQVGRSTGSGINYNQLGEMRGSFSAFWFWVPAVGALAAFALHNLRDAFSMTPAPRESAETAS